MGRDDGQEPEATAAPTKRGMTTPGDTDYPTDAVLLELGRLVWAAMDLEYVANVVCRCVRPRRGPFDDLPVGARINEALRDLLNERPANALRNTAEHWLREAKAALEERHTILHSIPGTFVPLPGAEDSAASEPWLMHFPALRGKGERKPPVHTRLTVENLALIRGRLGSAADGGIDLWGPLWDSHPDWT